MVGTLGTRTFWDVCGTANAESSRFGTSSNPSQKIVFALELCESFLNLPLIMLDCVVPISINRYG